MAELETGPGVRYLHTKEEARQRAGEKAAGGREFEELVDFLKVLADRSRLRILGLLSEREYTVREMASVLGLKEPTVSLHLNMLKSRELVMMRKEGTSHFYSLSQESVFALLKEVAQKANTGLEEDPNSSEFERHVLQHFFSEGQLREIPVRRSKQLVVLRRLAQEFTAGDLYSEKVVNETLKRFHPDCASLRRLLVDYRLMARKNGFYWRLETAPDGPA
jgi:DNA-binding transcriptional ArsR family regulator